MEPLCSPAVANAGKRSRLEPPETRVKRLNSLPLVATVRYRGGMVRRGSTEGRVTDGTARRKRRRAHILSTSLTGSSSSSSSRESRSQPGSQDGQPSRSFSIVTSGTLSSSSTSAATRASKLFSRPTGR